jgi:uncharacterized SAM-binding protein YcdF (DUF218 family)
VFIFLSKFLPLLIYPLGLAILLLVLSLFLTGKRPRLGRGLVIAAVVVLWLGSNHWISMALSRGLEWQYFPPSPAPKVDAIVVLGGATSPMQYPRPLVEISGAGDRMLYAADLFKKGAAPYILLSGGNIEWMRDKKSTPASEMAQVLDMLGIPLDSVWLQDKSRNTHEDAVYSALILKEKGATRILLVTSALHMPRSVALFKKQGLEVIPAPADYRVTQAGWDELVSGSLESKIIALVPDASDLGSTINALKEYFGMFVYRWMGWT